MSEPQKWKWDVETKALHRYLLKLAARALPEEPDSHNDNATINSKNSGRILIQGGIDDLRELEGPFGLFYILDGLDERERETAYRDLFHFVRGTLDIAGYAITPSSAMHKFDAAQSAMMRRRRSQSTITRDELVYAALRGDNRKPKQQLPTANEKLREAGYNEISERQLRRILHARMVTLQQ